MTARDALGSQFVTLYHGTRTKNVPKIKAEGLRRNTNVIGKWPTLTDDKEQAQRYAQPGGKGSVVTVRTQRRNLTEPEPHTAYGHPAATSYGLMRDIPPEHIR